MKQILIVLIVAALVVGGVYLDWRAYHARFPNAPAWTFFFNHR